MTKIWIDMINPSHPLFFRPVINEFRRENELIVTLRNRGETVKLASKFGINGKVIGSDFEDVVRKTSSIAFRSIVLSLKVPKFDVALSFENPMSVVASKIRGKRSILLLDNDLKFKIKGNLFQNVESKLKMSATNILVPEACRETFNNFKVKDNLEYYDGYKEDIYIADHQPDPSVLEKIPFKEYCLLRPEALASFYVKEKRSIVPAIIEEFKKAGKNILLLPRDKSDFKYTNDEFVHVLKEPLNGLDLVHFSNGVMTGSGTFAREAAVMGKPAVSFFPGKELLSVDQKLVNEGKILHTRDIPNIMEYLEGSRTDPTMKDRSRKVKDSLMNTLREKIKGI